jgi:hypothetical protein
MERSLGGIGRAGPRLKISAGDPLDSAKARLKDERPRSRRAERSPAQSMRERSTSGVGRPAAVLGGPVGLGQFRRRSAKGLASLPTQHLR